MPIYRRGGGGRRLRRLRDGANAKRVVGNEQRERAQAAHDPSHHEPRLEPKLAQPDSGEHINTKDGISAPEAHM